MVAAFATHTQTTRKSTASTSNDGNGQSQVRHNGLTYQIGQAQLPLSFGLIDTATTARTQSLVILRDGGCG